MLRLWLALGVVIVALIVSGLAVSMAGAQAGPDPGLVIAGYETARNQRDVDGALAYFADDATVSQRATTFSGKDDIRKYIEGFSSRARATVIADRHTSGNRVTWTERAGAQQGPGQQSQSQGLNGAVNATAFQVTVEAIVQDGKIRSLTYLPPTVATRIDPSLDGRAQLPATAGLAAVLAVGLSMLLVGSIGLRRPTRASSTLHGRLMQGLRGWTAARQ